MIKPEGHPDVKKGKPFIWSNVMELQDCKEETPKPPNKASAKPKQTEQTQTPQKSAQDIEETPKGSESVDKENRKEENSLESGEAS
ncbi:hypothetical protein AAGG52_15300 [Bacillus licheniformis]